MANKNTLLAGILFKQWFQSKEGLNQHNRNDRAKHLHRRPAALLDLPTTCNVSASGCAKPSVVSALQNDYNADRLL
jgi:hypothetical protein